MYFVAVGVVVAVLAGDDLTKDLTGAAVDDDDSFDRDFFPPGYLGPTLFFFVGGIVVVATVVFVVDVVVVVVVF